MLETTEIRRYPDGSIDLRHYEALGRTEHAKAVRRQFGAWLAAARRLSAHLGRAGTAACRRARQALRFRLMRVRGWRRAA